MRSFIFFYSSPNIIRQIKSRRMRWGDMWHAWERRGKFTGLWWESHKERDHLEDQGINGRRVRMDLCRVDPIGSG
jgi:hypothetical protein